MITLLLLHNARLIQAARAERAATAAAYGLLAPGATVTWRNGEWAAQALAPMVVVQDHGPRVTVRVLGREGELERTVSKALVQ